MPSPSSEAVKAAGTYLARGRRFATIDLNDRDKLAEQFDTFAAARVAEARAEMRERAAITCGAHRHSIAAPGAWDELDRIANYSNKTVELVQRAIRALPLSPNPETTT